MCTCLIWYRNMGGGDNMNNSQPDGLQQKLYRYGNWPVAACAGEVNVWQQYCNSYCNIVSVLTFVQSVY